ncbi:MAG: hypothetical protein EOP46_07490 [Sphingobacteriaceae bacterium]|nr:MAG: hypothetical protein EOP46_07490 [Sphingobacteriaceae bacterium]
MSSTIKQRIEQLLSSTGNNQTDAELLLVEIRHAIKNDPLLGKELGLYIAKLNAFIKLQNTSTQLSWQQVAGGKLAIGHKPGGKVSFEGLKKDGATAIVTLLQENEGAHTIGKAAQQAGMTWLWLPFSASRPHSGNALVLVLEVFEQMQNILKNSGGIYIHCSAGIHRTGMITYGFLRHIGQSKSEALQTLMQLRVVTAEQAGEDRLSWGDNFAIDT